MFMILPYLLFMLLVSKPGRLMMLISTYVFIEATLTIPPLGCIAMVHVSWSFYSSNVDHSVVAPTISILHTYCILDISTFFSSALILI